MPKPLVQSTGRRKQAVARVRLRTGEGKLTVNGRPLDAYFPSVTHRNVASAPIALLASASAVQGLTYDVDASIGGGGYSGQAGALSLGIARGLAELNPELRDELKRAGLLRRDPRKKESKKYGLKKARKAPQYSKR